MQNNLQKHSNINTKKLVVTAILSAIIVVLQLFCTMLASLGLVPVAPTLALVPILVGSAMYGIGTGTFLGAIFGIIVFIVDPTARLLMGMNLFATMVLCIAKGAFAGAAAGAVYGLLKNKNELGGIVAAGIAAPIVNTGLFVLGMVVFFKQVIFEWAAASGEPTFFGYVIFGLCGINFVVELVVNLLLATAINIIVRESKKHVQ